MFGASADDRRRCEGLRSCKTLQKLHKKLVELGYQVSKSAAYYRCLPRDATTIEGKRHVITVPVKLCRAQSDQHRDHEDQKFCINTIRSLEILASILGPKEVFFLSQDDKAKVPIGITAANKQAPFLMHVEYRVRLPDHDWVIANKHKLIPSVYAAVKIKSKMMGQPEAVGYSGPTYIAIRSCKHSLSTSETHAVDLDRLFELDAFKVVIITTDGGPDENLRFPKVISQAIKFFKKYNLDALFIATNAPGRSAYNRIE